MTYYYNPSESRVAKFEVVRKILGASFGEGLESISGWHLIHDSSSKPSALPGQEVEPLLPLDEDNGVYTATSYQIIDEFGTVSPSIMYVTGMPETMPASLSTDGLLIVGAEDAEP